jgi:hypothetical protein
MTAFEFVKRWHGRAAESPDCFDRFFSAWIALVIEARRHLGTEQLAQPDTDRIAMIQYFESHADAVVGVLTYLREHIDWLARRRGTGTNQPILDVNPYAPEHLRRDFDELAMVWLGQLQRKPRWIACKTAEMVNHVRNNMFHASKFRTIRPIANWWNT